MPLLDTINFTLHEEEHTVKLTNVPPETTLLQYLRYHECLTGTKYMCLEGGCGACVVSVSGKDPVTKKTYNFAVNSCLVSIYSCGGWEIHTVEGIGNRRIGYHPIQKQLANFNGTQCGYCSPGMVMNMYALYQSNNLTMKTIEQSFGGNICRCTGYRPILTAFKNLAIDANSKILGECSDIENLGNCLQNGEKKCKSSCKRNNAITNYYGNKNSKWYKAFSVNEILDILNNNPTSTYQLVAGNTAKGVYPTRTFPDIYIDITSVGTLKTTNLTSTSLVIGANKTLNETIDLFRQFSSSYTEFAYLDKLADHLELVAHVPVRNIGTLAGNLSIKHSQNEFPSDIFLILETIGAKLTIVNSLNAEADYTLENYLSLDMNKRVIKSITIPKLGNTYKYGSYKIMPRFQNAHAMVNAGFLLNIDNNQTVKSARIVYGGINPSFVHANNTERYLIGKQIFNNDILQSTFDTLNGEVNPDNVLPQPSPEFRKQLSISLFYKFILNIAPESAVTAENKSGGKFISILNRPISNGAQDFQSNESLYPLTQPIRKIEALTQTSGDAEYITDITNQCDQLFASFVTAKIIAKSVISKIDASDALKMEGVVAFYDKNDIPGLNTFVPSNANYPTIFFPPPLGVVEEELFCSGVVQYYNQPVGVIIANTQELADIAADMVKITYTASSEKPLLTIQQILAANATDRITNEASLQATRTGTNVQRTIKGTYDTNWQYHFHMETQTTVVIPKEGGLDIYPATQWIDLINVAVARVLNIPENRINIHVRRVGGAFGSKVTRNSLISCATALAAYKLQRPVRMRMNLTKNMDVIGKRFPCSSNYTVKVDNDGVIQSLDDTFYVDYATGGNEALISIAFSTFFSGYKHDTWNVLGYNTKTDNHAGVWMRSPVYIHMVGIIEAIMEHIAFELNKPAVDIRLKNMDAVENKSIIGFINDLMNYANYNNRLSDVENFNKENRWIKKGLSLVPMTYEIGYAGSFTVTITIYAGDGSVALSHGGIEMGQGVNTKLTQVCAYALGIDVEMVSIKPSNNFTSGNNFLSGGSFTTEILSYATLEACAILLDRMKPVRDTMVNPTWPELVKRCQDQYINLSAQYMTSQNDFATPAYPVYGVAISEVEVDILTGIHQVTRADLLVDVGNSMSPLIDIGQVEGAFIMGLGFWTTEEIIYNDKGRLITNRTWTYKPPGALDIPIDFRVKFPSNNPNPVGVLNSKATSEPAICLACSIPFAIRRAVASARISADPTQPTWYPINGPSTVENTFMNSLNNYKQYKL